MFLCVSKHIPLVSVECKGIFFTSFSEACLKLITLSQHTCSATSLASAAFDGPLLNACVTSIEKHSM